MSTPATLLLVLFFIRLLLHAKDHGKPKTGTHSFWIGLLATVITLSLLAWGGFFDPHFIIGGQ